MGNFWKDFGRGFQKGFGGALKVGGHIVPIPGLSAAGGEIMKLHKGGKVARTGNYRLRGGEVVLNRTQQRRIKNAKTTKTRMKVFNQVKRQRPKPMGKRRKR